MIRIWNYNKNRIHSYRGVRYLHISLDDCVIFRGEIKRAAGTTSVDAEMCSECILFTTNPSILGLIEKYDPIAQLAIQRKREMDLAEEKSNASRKVHWGDVIRHLDSGGGAPSGAPNAVTPDAKFSLGEDLSERVQWSNDSNVKRPTTGKTRQKEVAGKKNISMDIWPIESNDGHDIEEGNTADFLAQSVDLGSLNIRNSHFEVNMVRPQSTHTHIRIRPSTAAVARVMPPVAVRAYIELFLLSSWGDPNWIGLSSVCGLNANLEEFELPVPEACYYTYSAEGVSLSRMSNVDHCYNDVLVRNSKLTTNYEDMWVCELKKNCIVGLKFIFDEPKSIKGVRLWNFNAGKEDTCLGVKHMEISIDGGRRKAVIVRKAPGNCNFDYSQFIPVSNQQTNKSPVRSLYKSASSFDDLQTASPSRLTSVDRDHDTPRRKDLLNAAFADQESKSATSDVDSPPGATVVVDEDYESDNSGCFDNAVERKEAEHRELKRRPASAGDCVCQVPQLYETPVCFKRDFYCELFSSPSCFAFSTSKSLWWNCRLTPLAVWSSSFSRTLTAIRITLVSTG